MPCVNREESCGEDKIDKRCMIAIKWLLICTAEHNAYYSCMLPEANQEVGESDGGLCG